MRRDEFGQPFVDLRPCLRRHYRFERRARNLDGEIAWPLMPGVDDRRRLDCRADEEMADRVNRFLRGGKADPQQPVVAEGGEALE